MITTAYDRDLNTQCDVLSKTFILFSRCIHMMLIPQPESAKPATVSPWNVADIPSSSFSSFLMTYISDRVYTELKWASSGFLWKQEKTYSMDYIHHLFCPCISIEFTSINLLGNLKKCRNFATHSDEAIITKLDFETWHGDMHAEGKLPRVNYNWLIRLTCRQKLTLRLYKL